jgi:peptidoglycan/LPS O-acetylase OafA/YrhL
MKTTSSSHITAFDTVRGLAALSVVFSHYIGAYGWPTKSVAVKQAWTYTPLHIAWDGFAAVSLFYVLSGLVLSMKYFRETSQPNLAGFRLTEYLTRRVFRIWPPYLFVFVLSYFLRRWVGYYDGATIPHVNTWLFSTWGGSIPLVQLLREAFLIQAKDYALVPQGWTLPIELFISFLVPVGILLASRNTGWLILFTLILIGPLGASYYILHFVIGILLAKYYASIRLWLEPRRGWKIAILLLGLFLYTFRYTLPVYLEWNLKASIPWIVTGFGAALLIVVVIASERARSILSLGFLRFIGRVSFSVYLLHFLVIIILMTRVFHLLNLPASASALGWWLGLTLTVLATLGLAALTHRFIELPSMAVGKTLPKRLADWKLRRAESQPLSGK